MYFNQFYFWNIVSACTKDGNGLLKGRGCSSMDILDFTKVRLASALGFLLCDTWSIRYDQVKAWNFKNSMPTMRLNKPPLLWIFNWSCKVPNNIYVNKNDSSMIFYDSIRMFLWTWRFWAYQIPVTYNLRNDLVVFASKSKLWLVICSTF